jgi:hypothetical protein
LFIGTGLLKNTFVSLIFLSFLPLQTLIAGSPGNKSEVYRRQFLTTVEAIVVHFGSSSSNVCKNILSILFLLLQDDKNQKYSTQTARQSCLHSAIPHVLLELNQKSDDEDLKYVITNVLNLLAKDLS